MLITVKNINNWPEAYFKYHIMNRARIYAAGFKYGADGIALDQYLTKNYSIGLRAACLKLLCNLSLDFQGDSCVLYFKNNYYDKLARLITYGTGQLKGISILKKMFS